MVENLFKIIIHMRLTNQENTLATAVKYAVKPGGSCFHNQEYWVKKAIHIASKENIVASKVAVRDILECVHSGHVDLAAQLYHKAPVKARVQNLLINFAQLAQQENQDNLELQKLEIETIEKAFKNFESLAVFIVTKEMGNNPFKENHGAEDLVKLLLSNVSSETNIDDSKMSKIVGTIMNIIDQDPSVNKSIELFKIFASIVPVRDVGTLVDPKDPKDPKSKFSKYDIDVQFENGKPSIIASLKINENNFIGKGLANLGQSTGGMHISTDDFRIPSPVDITLGVEKDGTLSVEAELDVPGGGAVSTAVKAIGQTVDNHHHDA